jgi:hypothetical protein
MTLFISAVNTSGILTTSLSAFGFLPLQDIMPPSTAEEIIAAQAKKVVHGQYSPARKEQLNKQLEHLRHPKKFGIVETAAVPGGFTSKSKIYALL